MSELSLATCPICHAQDSLSRETMERAGRPFTWYECRECGSVLLWVGDDQWAYQKVGREDKQHLMKRPLSADELVRMVTSVQSEPDVPSVEQVRIKPAYPEPIEAQAKAGQAKWTPSPVLLVGLALAILVFAGGLAILLVLLPPSAEPSATASPTPSPAFSAGMEVRLVASLSDEVPVFEIKSGNCGFSFSESTEVSTGESATILDGICYREKNREFYYEVRTADTTGWVRESYVVPADQYGLPRATPTPRPASAPKPLPTSRPSGAKRGWLCDFDRTGSIRLWTTASMDATVKDVVGTCIGCCVDVTMYEEESANAILFYRISVGAQSGWVDVDYFYWRKPSWSTN